MKVGFIGLGIMGKPMALNLLRAGYSMAVYNRTREKCKFLEEAGAEVKDTPAEVAMVSDVVIVIVTDTPDVESVLFGPDGVSEGLSPGKVLIDMSTISPDKTVDFAIQLQEVGVEMLDAPVSGGERGAKEGSLTIMVGGNEEVYESCLPIFQAMGKNIAHVGRNGDGQRVKLVNQVICGLNILAVVEGMRLARESGLDTKIVHQVVSTGAAGSWMLSNLGRAILSEDYSPGFKIALQSKDLRLAIESMHALEMDAPGTELTYSLFKRASESGLGELGTQGLLKLFEDEDGQ
jgi:3-hydroxyisobutyrate dehydrogenase